VATGGDRTSWYDPNVTQSSSRLVGVHYAVPARRTDEAWELPDETMPESVLHDDVVELLKALLAFWARGTTATASKAFVARNLAIRWDEDHPKVGVDPDVCVLRPAPPNVQDLGSVRTWVPGHNAPILAIEVVSESNPRKDYAIAPDKYAASGTGELWIFDPLLAGPAAHGGPHRLQLWSRRPDGDLVRIYAGDGPTFSPVMEAWLVVVDEGRRLRIADDQAATRFWMTGEESERVARESERVARESERVAKESALRAEALERAAKESALARVAELEAALKKGSL
jgi:Uma2 family endonuclease